MAVPAALQGAVSNLQTARGLGVVTASLSTTLLVLVWLPKKCACTERRHWFGDWPLLTNACDYQHSFLAYPFPKLGNWGNGIVVYFYVNSIDRSSEKRFTLGGRLWGEVPCWLSLERQKKRQLSDVQISSPISSFGNLFFGFIAYRHYVILIYLQELF